MAEAPAEGPQDALQGLLALALHVAECEKRVSFPSFSWDAPGFRSEDAKAGVSLPFATLVARDAGGVRDALVASLPRLEGPRGILAVDARASGLAEFELGHLLYGEATLFQFRHRPAESADPRIDDAREKGWSRTLKLHNLLPGRGLVVLDEHQGLLLREDALAGLQGLLVLLASGAVELMLNPFAARGDPEMQHWLNWGRGTGAASEWRTLLHVDERED